MVHGLERIEHERRWLAYHKARKGTSDQQKARVAAKQQQAEERREEEDRRDQSEREKQAWSYMYQTPEWRFLDRPRPGSVYRLPDNTALQRGITFTVIPDGRRMQVPPMFRNEVQALAEKHQASENADIVQALQNIIQGRKPQPNEARLGADGRVHRGRRVPAPPHRIPVAG